MNLQKPPLLTQKLSNHLLTDSIIATLVLLSPLVFYLYLCFPNVKIWETFLFTYESKFYENVATFMWVFLQKFIFLYLMLIWYFTSTNWWNKAILSPLGISLYQIINLLNDDMKYKDEGLDSIVVIPVILCILYILYKIRNRMVSRLKRIELVERMDIEINKIKNSVNV